ncbi:hypothetical protein CLSA_c23940 [Clostridium saccharobutylicum DSM 13864]|uniref:DUF4352 domain-containing protein n=1 Tax=Clostridium saccharobutylicum DSM 13864 TaxID=1345695 RepID=U5MS85_CLOSA|nr:hypothetical protein [Clostridium saccharobutylicum]AGX43368.1 hypothetical protein CLSA_c23940 [Clostridium saccharobutylicum DSM 13864]OAV41409.1 hypothetical protein M945_1157 [Clostridium saccharobutylicum DSM 13864]
MMKGGFAVITFIKSNSDMLLLLLMLFITLDTFLLFYKLKKYSSPAINLKISYDASRSYSSSLYCNNKYQLTIIHLNIENESANTIEITTVKLIDENNSYLAVFPKITDDYNENGITLISEDKSKFIKINTLSENILKNTTICSHNDLNGYAVFQNVEPITQTKSYKLIVQTLIGTFEKEIILNPINI